MEGYSTCLDDLRVIIINLYNILSFALIFYLIFKTSKQEERIPFPSPVSSQLLLSRILLFFSPFKLINTSYKNPNRIFFFF